MRIIVLATSFMLGVLLVPSVVQGGPFERRLESNLEPAIDEAMRKVFLLDLLERLNQRPAKAVRPRSTSQPTATTPAQIAPAAPETQSHQPPADPPSRPARRRLFRR
jgi:hypothetical protein